MAMGINRVIEEEWEGGRGEGGMESCAFSGSSRWALR